MGLKFVDFFCGIGTIRMGMEKAGHECVYSVEWDKHKRRMYGVIFGKEPEGQDIRGVHAIDIPRSDVWCFGFPCQDISVAGKQLGFAGERSSLFFDVMRLLREAEEVGNKPRYLFIENVKNLLSVNEGWDFFNLLYTLDEVRYDAEWQLANSKHFGVPQNRERVYIIGHIRGGCTRKVFPITGCDREVDIKFIGNVMPTKTRKNPNQGRVYDTSGVTPALTKMEGGGRQPFITVKEATKQGYAVAEEGDSINLAFPDSKTRRGRVGKGVAQTLDKSCNQRVVVRACLTPGRMEKRQNGRRFKGPGEPMFTLTKQDIHGVAITYNRKEGVKGEIDIAHTLNSSDYRGLNRNQDQTAIMEGVRIRRLTPRECWRLQAVEESIIDKVMAAGISDTQMYKGAGDACTVNVIYEIAKKF